MKPAGMGTDISVYRQGEAGIGRVLRLVSEQDLLIEALLKRLETPKGWLARFVSPTRSDYADYQEYGHDISDLLNKRYTPAKVLAEETEIKIQMESDDRVQEARVNVAISITANILRIDIRIIPKRGGPFRLVLGPEGNPPTLKILQQIQG